MKLLDIYQATMKLLNTSIVGTLLLVFISGFTHCQCVALLSDEHKIDDVKVRSNVSSTQEMVTTGNSGKSKSEYLSKLSGISDNVAEILSALCFIFLSACILQFIISKINDKIPISIVLFIFGMITYAIILPFKDEKYSSWPLLKAINSIRNIDNSILYYIALPILLYEATQEINWYTFCNFLLGGVALAVVGVIMQVAILGVLFKYLIGSGEPGFTLSMSFLLASILSSTDPVAVLAILGGAQAPNKLSPMFNCESLINDGTSVQLFQFFYQLSTELPNPCGTAESAISGVSRVEDLDNDIPLFKYSGIKHKLSEAENYDPKLYLCLLEHALTLDKSIPTEDVAVGCDDSSPFRHVHAPQGMKPKRTDTDATVNLEFMDVVSNKSNAVIDLEDNTSRKVLRVEREGELYIMIFNSFSYMYNEMYKSGLIDGGSLLALQSVLDIAEDFAVKRLEKRSISAWKSVLTGYVNDPHTLDFVNKVEDMDGFEFEWFVLKSTIDGNTAKGNLFHISKKLHVFSILEIVVAYVDVHTQLLEIGGNNMERLLDNKLLVSYKKQISLAKLHIMSVRAKEPVPYMKSLMCMAACMMIRLKRGIADEQCAKGLLLDEDRRQIYSMLDDQLYKISTRMDWFKTLKRLIKKTYQRLCFRGHASHNTS